MSRSERRRSATAALRTPANDVTTLLAHIRAAKLLGSPPAMVERARKAIHAYVESAAAHGMPFREITARLADGRCTETVADTEARDAQARGYDPMEGAACASGCAFCCILSGEDGGTITLTEAERLHAALAPFAGEPDGRDWHPKACPALHPETRMCRVYDARPGICRAFHSTDADACEANAAGEPVPGARLAGSHVAFLIALGLSRAALSGRTRVDTFSLYETAQSAVEGKPLPESKKAARHRASALDAERRRTGKAVRRIGNP